MITTVTKDEFVRAFDDYGRSENFSRAGRMALFDWLEDLDDSKGEPKEVDVIGLCCEFAEYDSMEEVCEEYDMHSQEIHDSTTVIQFDGGVIIQQF